MSDQPVFAADDLVDLTVLDADEAAAPARPRSGTALALSGGGFRAALYHLGALSRLNELGVLSQADTISAVSGGSIIAAHLVSRVDAWPTPGEPIPAWDRTVAEPFRAICGQNLRTGPLLRRLLPWNWFRESTAVEDLADAYARALTARRLGDLPPRPRLVVCATDMTFGVNWTFESATSDGGPPRMGDYLAGYAPAASWPLARAVAAASCFPPVFNPLPLHLDPAALTRGDYRGPERDQLVAGIRLSDGGLYDNLGLEPVWKRHATVLVSDGGGVFEQAPDRGLVWRVQRYTRIIERQSRALRTRWLMAGASDPAQNLAIAYWGIGRAPEAASPGAPTYA